MAMMNWYAIKPVIPNLKRFIRTDAGHLFKGRLQLDKKNDHIVINVKGSTAGIISLTDFERLIN
jgi:hypothetical protein